MTVHLTPPQQRRMQKLAAAVDRASQADRRFFERFPERRHRVRLASQAEIEQLEILRGAPIWVPPGGWIHIVVRFIAPGVRMRLYFCPRAHDSADSENLASEIFEAHASPATWRKEALLRRAAEARP